jgi:hypothetical protein
VLRANRTNGRTPISGNQNRNPERVLWKFL